MDESIFRRGSRLGVLAAVGLASLSPGPVLGAIADPVRIETGLLQGVTARDPTISVYQGVPYAAPPTGALRWKAPQPPIPWAGVRRADQFGASCPQETSAEAAVTMSEDCLFLNVWTGAASSTERRPVFVWIYGGGFTGGSGSNPQFDGASLAHKGVVVVTFNYRLGALGFLATPELSRESGHHASGNYGLLDDVAVLRWVHRNIQAFGGDPARVTIGGQSAGAGSVGFLSLSPLARGLFERSIAESHARYPRDLELRYLSVSWRPLKTAEGAGEKYVQGLGAHSLSELRALPWQKLVVDSSASDPDVDTGSAAMAPLFRPTVDGWVIPASYSETYTRGTQNDVEFLAGNNRDETGGIPETAFATLRGRVSKPGFMRPGMPEPIVTLAAYRKAGARKFGPLATEFFRLYPANTDDEAAEQYSSASRDNSRVSTYLWGTEWVRHAHRPVFTYFWTHRPPGPDHDLRGAYHGSEIPYVFGNLYPPDRPWTDADRKIADIMSSYWANYIASGDPNGPSMPRWPAYDPNAATVMELGDHFAPIPVASPEKLAFWKRFFATQDAW